MISQNNNVLNLNASPTAFKQKKFDHDSNLYIAGLPRDYNKDKLYQLFAPFGSILRFKFVSPKDDTKCPYGFVQFSNPICAQQAIKDLNGCILDNHAPIEVSIAAVGRRSVLKSDEPTNLYIENTPASWNNDILASTFGQFGTILQSKMAGNHVAFVRYETHQQALNAINHMHREPISLNKRLNVRFATCQSKKAQKQNQYEHDEEDGRTHGSNAEYAPSLKKSNDNENNLYVKNIPKNYNQMDLENLFSSFGAISSATIINDSIGVAFVRYKHSENAQTAIRKLNATKPALFEKEIIVKMAHSDIALASASNWSNCNNDDAYQWSLHCAKELEDKHRVMCIVKGYIHNEEEVASDAIVSMISQYYYDYDNVVNEDDDTLLDGINTLDDRLDYMQQYVYDIQSSMNNILFQSEQKRMHEMESMQKHFHGVIARLYTQMNNELQIVAHTFAQNQHKESLRIKMLEHHIYELNTERNKQNDEMYKMQQQINGLLYNDILPQNERVRIWLTETVGLLQYHDIFIQNGYDDMESIADITKKDLLLLGIDKVGHQKKIIKYAQKLPKRLQSPKDTHTSSSNSNTSSISPPKPWLCQHCHCYNVSQSNQCVDCGHITNSKMMNNELHFLSNTNTIDSM